jgi:MYXO-CTERM domain-containing protein
MVGYGLQGVDVGAAGTAGTSRWAAVNTVDMVGAAGFNRPNSTNIISTDFDNGTELGNTLGGAPVNSFATPLQAEGTVAVGDSGGPLLFHVQNDFVIGGVLTGGTTPDGAFGDISWWTGVGKFRAQIEAAGGVFISAVPEPASWAMALMGLCAFGAIGRRRQLR